MSGLQTLVDRAAALLGCDTCVLFVLRGEDMPLPHRGARPFVAASAGLEGSPEAFVDAVLDRFSSVGRGRSADGWTLAEGSGPAAADEAALEEAIVEVTGSASHLILPIGEASGGSGLVFMGSRRPRRFTAEDTRLFEILGSAVKAAIETAAVAAGRVEAREKEISALHEIMKEISALGSLDRVLALICRKSAELLGVEISYVALADRAEREIRMRMTHGISPYWRDRMSMAFGVGVGGMVAKERRPVIIEDYAGFEHSTRPDIRDMVLSEGVKAIVAVPMLIAGKVTGVLYAADRRPSQFTEKDARLLQGMADQAAIAIANSQLYEQERREVEVHDRLSAIVLRDGDYRAIAEALHGLVENPTALHDVYGNLLACHPPSLEESWPPVPADARQPVILTPSEEDGREAPVAVAPVWSGEELLGHVHVLQQGRTLDVYDLRVVERAAVIVALRMMRMRVEAEVEQRLRGDILDDLLSDVTETVESAVRRSQQLGYDAARPHGVLLVEPAGGADPGGVDGAAESVEARPHQQLFSHVRRALLAAQVESLVTLKGERVVGLVRAPDGSAEGGSFPQDLGSALRARLRAHLPGVPVRAGLGATADQPSGLRRSYEEALVCLQAAVETASGFSFVTHDDLGVLSILYDPADPGRLSRFVRSRLGDLMEYDAEHRADLVHTLATYLDTACNKVEASRELNVHLSTLKYRLDRISGIVGLDLRDSDVRFEAHLATRALAAEQRLKRGVDDSRPTSTGNGSPADTPGY